MSWIKVTVGVKVEGEPELLTSEAAGATFGQALATACSRLDLTTDQVGAQQEGQPAGPLLKLAWLTARVECWESYEGYQTLGSQELSNLLTTRTRGLGIPSSGESSPGPSSQTAAPERAPKSRSR